MSILDLFICIVASISVVINIKQLLDVKKEEEVIKAHFKAKRDILEIKDISYDES